MIPFIYAKNNINNPYSRLIFRWSGQMRYLGMVEKDDPRRTKYILVGTALDKHSPVGIIGRFASNGGYLIITVYEITEAQG